MMTAGSPFVTNGTVRPLVSLTFEMTDSVFDERTRTVTNDGIVGLGAIRAGEGQRNCNAANEKQGDEYGVDDRTTTHTGRSLAAERKL